MSETTRIAELEAIARSDDFGRDNTGAEWVRGPDGARWYVAGVHGLLLEAVDALATRDRELAEALTFANSWIAFETGGAELPQTLHEAIAALIRSRELHINDAGTARADLAAVEAVDAYRKRPDWQIGVEDSLMWSAIRWEGEERERLAEYVNGESLVALGRALLATEADDATTKPNDR